ncbi:MAG: ankyrin repeat domain-containing protein [Huintestinicola sp.]
MLTILSNVGAVRILFIIGITITVLPIFFYNIPKYRRKNSTERPPFFKSFPLMILCGIIMIIPMLCYFYLDIRYDAGSFTLNDKLFLAAENGSIKAAKSLIEEGAEPDGDTRYGVTPQFHAVEKDNTELVMLFLQNGADPNYPGNDKITQISAAARNQSCEMAKLLIAAGADPDYMPESFVPALHYAGIYDKDYNSELVNILIAGGADPSLPAYKNGRKLLPYRYYYDKHKTDADITPEEEERFGQISARLYPAYSENLMDNVHENFGLDAIKEDDDNETVS